MRLTLPTTKLSGIWFWKHALRCPTELGWYWKYCKIEDILGIVHFPSKRNSKMNGSNRE